MSENPHEFSVDGILGLLRSQGMRITRSRRGIMSALFKATKPLNLLEIQKEALAEGGVLPDYATVFRMMMLLERLRLVHKVNLKRSCSYFELTNPSRHYDHLVCTTCGKVTALELPSAVDETLRQIKASYGYSDLHYSLEFFGRCPDCADITGPVAVDEPLDPVSLPAELDSEPV